MKKFSTLYYALIINLYIMSSLCFLTTNIKALPNLTPMPPIPMEPVTNAFKIRSPGLNGAQKISGESPGVITHAYYDLENQFPAYDDLLLGPVPSRIFGSKSNLFVSATGSYNQSINPASITHALFGNTLLNDACDRLLIQGTHVADRNPKALLADYFYLPDTYESLISFNPTIATSVVNVNLYAQSNNVVPGLYARVSLPYVYSKWNLAAKEQRVTTQNQNNSEGDGQDNGDNHNTVAAGRFSPLEVPAENLLPDALSFFAGFTPEPIEPPQTGVIGTDPVADFPITREGLLFPLFNCQDTRMHGLSEIRYELGYDFWQAENSHLGIYLAGAIPSFMHKKRCSLFHPIIDNGNHVEFGVGFSGHYQLWQNCNENQQMSICADAQITHLCSAKEFRSFDLKDKPLSRYMLAAKHMPVDNGGLNELSGSVQRQAINGFINNLPLGDHKAGFQFDNRFAPIGNLTAKQVSVSINAQIDATVWLNYLAHGFAFDLGYNLWLQTAEKITCTSKSRLESEPYWAAHGDALVFSYFPILDYSPPQNVVDPESAGQALAIAASQSGAIIQTGTNAHAQSLPFQSGGQESFPDPLLPPMAGELNGGSDNVQFATARAAGGNTTWLSNTNIPAINGALRQTMISVDPIFLSPSDILINPKQKHMSHKLFGAIGYNFDCYTIAPYVGVGGEIEFGSTTHYNDHTCELNYALSKWGVWVKVGLSF